MKKVRTVIFALIIPACAVFGQQDPVLSQYMFNTQTYNPGYSGMTGMITATAMTRQQWVGFPGAPSTTIFNVSTPFSLFGLRSGAGLLVEADKYGFSNDINLSLSYSYLFNLGSGTLGAGFSAGMLNKTLAPEWFIPSGPSHTPPSGDPLIPENDESFVALDISAGIYYQALSYYAGFSVTHLNQPEIKYSETATYVSRQYYLTAGYYFQLPNPSLELIPSVFIANDGATTQYLATAMVRYNKKIWGGVSYRISDAITGFAGVELYNGLKIGYGYDFPISEIRKGTSGSHEFVVSYSFDLGLGKSVTKYKSIRFL
ncbi:MAG: type IX secretion system membrane protein PorP/SprF [Bacteroidales bacterium]|nr:type IX secretion system membrane protein PorP/SprF [Bacteroidales bacterium]